MDDSLITAAVVQAYAADTARSVKAARAALDASTDGIDPADFPLRCPEVIGAYELLDSLDREFGADTSPA